MFTDHKSLVAIVNKSNKETSARLKRLRLRLQECNFTMDYTKGANNPSDILSRQPLKTTIEQEDDKQINFVVNNAI